MTGHPSLEQVRNRIDAIDNAIQDLLIQRTQLVEEVRRIKHDWPIKIQPAREAEIVHRLLGRHHGAFPRRELVAIWRLIIMATLSFEGPFSCAVYLPEEDSGFWDLARDHFGPYTPMSRHKTARSVIDAVHRREATVGVLPVPRHGESDPWWPYIVSIQPDAPRVIARLPFAPGGNARGDHLQAVALCPISVGPTGRDRSYLVFESEERLSLTQAGDALAQAGFTPVFTAVREDASPPQAWLYLSEIEGHLGAEDARCERLRGLLGRALKRLVPLGAFALPLSLVELGPAPVAPARGATREGKA